MSEQELDVEDEESEQELYRTTGPMMTRRNLLRSGAALGAVAAMPAGANRLGVSPVGRAEAVAPIVAWAVVAAAGAGAKYAYDYYTTPEETMTKTQLHRTLRSIARGMDAAADEESEFENLVAERSHNWIWQDAVVEFVEGFNDTSSDAPNIEELKLQMETSILSDYGDLEQTVVDNQTTEVVQMLEMWNMVDSYGHQDSMGEFFAYHRSEHNNANERVWEPCYPTGEAAALEEYGLTGDEDVLRPFSDLHTDPITIKNGKQVVEGVKGDDYGPLTNVDDLVYTDYERVDGETFPAAIGWGNIVFYDGNSFTFGSLNYTSGAWTYYDEEDGITDIKINSGSAGSLPWDFQISDPDDGSYRGSYYTFLDFARRGNAISTIRSNATDLAGEVSSWVDQIDDNYARGNLPMADVVSTSRLWEEYQYEEGNPSITALAASQLGFQTNLKGTATVTDYGTIEYADGDELPAEGESHDGYLIVSVPEDAEPPTLDSGGVYDSRNWSNITFGITQPSGNTHEFTGVFRVDELRSYEGGEVKTEDSFTPSSYTFSPRDPNRYEEDVDKANNAREDATENPEINEGGGAGVGFGESGTRLALLGGGVLAGIAALLSMGGDDDQRGRRY